METAKYLSTPKGDRSVRLQRSAQLLAEADLYKVNVIYEPDGNPYTRVKASLLMPGKFMLKLCMTFFIYDKKCC